MGEGVEGFGKEEGEEVMETPERSRNNQIAASIAKFEESPVFNFLNNLSPIKPVKSIHITQTINPLSFASLPSVFASPHHVSLKESRFYQRHRLLDPSKPEFSCGEEGGGVDTNKENAEGTKKSGEHQVDKNADAINLVDQNKETASEWEDLLSNASDLIVFESPGDVNSYEKSVDPGESFYASMNNDMENMHTLLDSGEQLGERCELEDGSTHPEEGIETTQIADACDLIANPLLIDHGEENDHEHLSGICRGMRRRCLVFEMSGGQKRHFDEHFGSGSSNLLRSDGSTSSVDEQQHLSIRAGNDSSRRILPGIGLHLNALATTPKDYRIVNNDSSAASGRLLIGHGLSVNFHPSVAVQEPINNVVVPVAASDVEIDCPENAIVPFDSNDPNEDINQTSPKKKSRRTDSSGDGEACKRCNCKKSKCLKLYCECFAAGVYCVEPCACIDCFNKPIHEDTVLATRKQIETRNPLAFAPKVIRTSEVVAETKDDPNKTPASARHKRGCNCKKSGCLKKYCECYQGGVGCSDKCRCDGCKNTFGRKEDMEGEAEEDEPETNENSMADNDVDQNLDSAPIATPQQPGRQCVHLSSNKKPVRSFPSSVGSSRQVKSGYFRLPEKFDSKSGNNKGDEMPEILQGRSPPIGGVKLSSPNRKRVSPPHASGMSGRKLILHSIPSFPSLSPNL
ncbi:CRC domain-containing protein TSO1-like [Andrographis paniculata]|uniref:CRC domain-containing protein TSO1-like n=1 Tax=Andrographis paniculata TaxID=175694 RepID=UPI0021E74416|nr:CRC domain-containing protein TSO1-like [Andrographis paniculata]